LPPHMEALHGDVLRTARAFFQLSPAEKARIDYRQSPHFRGYMWLGAENTRGCRDEREQIEFGREEVASNTPLEPLYQRLRGPNQWPERPLELCITFSTWLEEMEKLARALTRALAAALGLEPHSLDALFGAAPHVQAKLVHYPSVEPRIEEQDAGSNLGVGAHSDSGFLTLLLQDEVGGLEVLSSSGLWVPAEPLPASLVCNLGELVQLLSGGRYLSTVHRVQRPPHSGLGRVSAPFFWNPALEAQIEPLVLPGDSTVVAPSAAERPGQAVNRLLPSYGMNAFKSLARSHPGVFARHHPDLQCLPDGLVVQRLAPFWTRGTRKYMRCR